ncbi:hypothetical protein JYT35_00865 [Acidimicrobium ferrooxidans]|uniref:ABC-three component systems C-terminal domain-containing protein n=1 Tax=Acidimicrobium ferrooxidans TaxID=53635 RepID=A0ABS3AQ76_9ACTN|nr:hypothetical protein [Acidimicrobium ferrooxidans]
MEVERAFWGLKFKVKFLEATGNEFQVLVQRIMELRFPDEFVTIKPAGRDGDWKNDGLLTDQRRMLQVYAPEGWKKSRVLAKIDADYLGAAAHWKDTFDTWTFTHNDMRGIPPYVLDRLNQLSKSTDNPHHCDQWGYAKLRELAFQLDDGRLVELLGPAVTLSHVLAVEVQDIIPMLRSLEDVAPAPLANVRPVPPDKLEKNALSEDAELLLLFGMRRSEEVGRYFDRQTMRPLFRDDLGARFTARYVTFREEGLEPDEIVLALVEWIAGPLVTPKTQAAALAIIAFFFEQCDIFEDPSKGTP